METIRTTSGTWVFVPFAGFTRFDFSLALLVLLVSLVLHTARAAARARRFRRVVIVACMAVAPPLAPLALDALLQQYMGHFSQWHEKNCWTDFAFWHTRPELAARWQKPHHVRGVLTPAECAELARTVVAHPEHYMHIRGLRGLPFFTSGVYWGYSPRTRDEAHSAASDVDSVVDATAPLTSAMPYTTAAARLRPWLGTFAPLHETLRATVERELAREPGWAGPVAWAPNLSRAGFHVLYPASMNTQSCACVRLSAILAVLPSCSCV